MIASPSQFIRAESQLLWIDGPPQSPAIRAEIGDVLGSGARSLRAGPYSGVSLGELMALVGAPRGDPLRGRALSIVVVAEASDGYRAAFTLADLDSAFRKASITLADHIQDVMDPAQAQLIEMKGFT